MGLDIRYYAKLEKADNPVSEEAGWDNDLMRPTINRDFPASRAEGLDDAWYHDKDSFHFRAGSYSGYNQWRDQLAAAAGLGSARQVWDNQTEGPFTELVNFSDCEGTIGPVVSAKLAKDFTEHRERIAKEMAGDDYFMRLYDEWATAFETAAGGGCVAFH